MICDNSKFIKLLENDLDFLINYKAKLEQQQSSVQDIKHINMQIKKLKRRIKELKATDGMEFNEITFRDGKVIYNEDLDRIQIIFNTLPSQKIVKLVQNSGFKWSDYTKSWQRYFNANGITATKWVLYKIQELERNELILMNIDGYIEHFDNTFKTNILETMKDKEFPMLNLAFYEIGEFLYARSCESKEITEQKNKISQQLNSIESIKEKKLIDKYRELDNDLRDDTDKQLLTFGFCLCYEQLKEMNALK